jgi:toxin ParE1/3/4
MIKPQARLDLLQIFIYIGEQNLSAAERFTVAVETDCETLARMPGMGRSRQFLRPELADIRSWPVGGFQDYLIFYRPGPAGIDVLRVIHGARDIDQLFKV